MKLVFATANPGKIREAEAILGDGFSLVPCSEAGIHEDIPETGSTLDENSLQKAMYVHSRTGLDCFADDSGLEVDLLDGAPGVETARYASPSRDPGLNMDKLLREMALRDPSLAPERRSARFRTCVTLILGGEVHVFHGTMEGHIALSRHGNGGFGYDPVFIPEGYTLTSAQLGEDVKNTISHRFKALKAMAEFLRENKR